MTKISCEIGEPPSFEMVDVSLIDIDRNYQRELDGNKVEKILREFHWDHFGALTLARKAEGRFAATDGQHRAKACQLHPNITHAPAMIIGRAGMEAEAENFLVINRDRKAVTPVERYWAGLAAGDITARRIRDVLSAAGCEVAPDSGTYKPNLTNAVTAVARALDRYGDRSVRLSVETIRKAWPKQAKALRGILIVALARIIESNEKIDQARLVAILAPKSFEEMTASAEAMRKISGGDAVTSLSRALTEMYNRGLSVNQLFFGVRK